MQIELTREELRILYSAICTYIFHNDTGASSQQEYETAEIIKINIENKLKK